MDIVPLDCSRQALERLIAFTDKVLGRDEISSTLSHTSLHKTNYFQQLFQSSISQFALLSKDERKGAPVRQGKAKSLGTVVGLPKLPLSPSPP